MFATILQFVVLSVTFQSICCEDEAKVIINDTYTIIGNKYEVKSLTGAMVDVHEYLGIPYAEAPVGKLRFAPPLRFQPKSTTLNAKTRPKTCWQDQMGDFEYNNTGARMWYNNTEMDEDCLYLNVWRPAGKTNLPVMVWIFGGGFVSGSASLEVYNATMLAGMGDVVVVSMQYRVGAFGFLCVKGAMESKVRTPWEKRVAACNMGLEDQQMALQWVNENIAAFGGNPESVTLFGESAGSASVSLHYLSSVSRQYFSQMIMQSASVFNRWALLDPWDAHDRANAFMHVCNCFKPESTWRERVNCLQEKDASELVALTWNVAGARAARRKERLGKLQPRLDQLYSDPSIYVSFEFVPTVDGVFLEECPDNILHKMANRTITVPPPKLLTGTMANEGMYWLLYAFALNNVSFLEADGNVTLPTAEALKEAKFDYYDTSTVKMLSTQYIIKQAVDFFQSGLAGAYGFHKSTDLTNSTEFMQRMDAVSGDVEFICGTQKFAQRIASIPRAAVYAYNFTHKTERNGFPGWTGAMHGYEIDYVFGMPFSEKFTTEFYNYTEAERSLSATVMKYWTNFAKTGNPTPNEDGDSKWPRFRLTSDKYMEINLKQTAKDSYLKAECKFWNDNLPREVRDELKSVTAYPPPYCIDSSEPYLYTSNHLRFYLPPYLNGNE